MVLRALDVDITPLLTGAGIIGLAVGFGAQTLVKDVISGFFMILEDQVRVGDVAIVNGTGGAVEQINLRTIVIRDMEGVGPRHPERADHHARQPQQGLLVLRAGPRHRLRRRRGPRHRGRAGDGGRGLQRDPAFRPHILEPLEVVGVDNFGASSVSSVADQDRPAQPVGGRPRAAPPVKKAFDRAASASPSSRSR